MFSLPAPVRSYNDVKEVEEVKKIIEYKEIPVYGSRESFHPTDVEDFQDGGAFPEIHISQYPRNLGKATSADKNQLSLQSNVDGSKDFSQLIRQNGIHTKDESTTVYHKLSHMKALSFADRKNLDLAAPSLEEQQTQLANTKLSLQQTADLKSNATKVHSITSAPKSQFVNINNQKIVRIVETQVDPLEPPRFRHRKVPGGAAADPVPVMHAPPKKLTIEEKQMWEIPVCVSNWKNNKGYTIPLEKRLVADGRNLVDNSVNGRFANFSEAMYVAETEMRKRMKEKNEIKAKIAEKQRSQEEVRLRELANETRRQRQTIARPSRSRSESTVSVSSSGSESEPEQKMKPKVKPTAEEEFRNRAAKNYGSRYTRGRSRSQSRERKQKPKERNRSLTPELRRHKKSRSRSKPDMEGTLEEIKHEGRRRVRRVRKVRRRDRERSRDSFEAREEVRLQERRARQKEYRLNKNAGFSKRTKLKTHKDRDISERIALGQNVPKAQTLSGDMQFDSRLFNGSGGLDAGFGGDADNNVYDKPLFNSVNTKIYKPSKVEKQEKYSMENLKEGRFTEEGANIEQYSKKLKPHRDFKGVDRSKAVHRTGPVQFEHGK